MSSLTPKDEWLVSELKRLRQKYRAEAKRKHTEAVRLFYYCKHLTDVKIGEKFGVSRSTISRIEANEDTDSL